MRATAAASGVTVGLLVHHYCTDKPLLTVTVRENSGRVDGRSLDPEF